MQPLPPQLELPQGDRFTLPTISAVREFVPPGPIAGSYGPNDDMRKRTLGPSGSRDSAADGEYSCSIP